MSTKLPTDTEAFHFFLTEQLGNGVADRSPEELLRQWRDEHAETIEDIRQGIVDMEAGRGRPLEEVEARIRAKLNMPPRS